MKHHINTNARYGCQYNLSKAIKSLSPKKRYLICCQLIGKDKTDAFLEDLAKYPLKRLLFKFKKIYYYKWW